MQSAENKINSDEYDGLTENFVLDKETREWIKDENPYAMMAMLAHLQETMNRGFWKADDEMQDKLKDVISNSKNG